MWPASTSAVAWSAYGTIIATTESPRPAYIAPMADRSVCVVAIELRSSQGKPLLPSATVEPRVAARGGGRASRQDARRTARGGRHPKGDLPGGSPVGGDGTKVPACAL